MSKFTKKVCPACGGIFQQRKETHEYCSGTCRTKAFRQRHEIEEPSFLNQPKKLEESSVKKVPPSDETKVLHEVISDFQTLELQNMFQTPPMLE